MILRKSTRAAAVTALALTTLMAGCAGGWGKFGRGCSTEHVGPDGCANGCGGRGCDGCDDCDDGMFGWWHRLCGGTRALSIPDRQPLGSVTRAHYHTMQTNAEAADFILHDHDFVGNTAELTPAGKDHIVEIGARMRSAPFPVLVERSDNNADPELDAHRRSIVAQILTDLGNPDAEQRTFVSPAYGRGLNSREAETDYYRFIFSRGGFGNFGNNFGGGFGGAGGFGGGGFGGGGFGF